MDEKKIEEVMDLVDRIVQGEYMQIHATSQAMDARGLEMVLEARSKLRQILGEQHG